MFLKLDCFLATLWRTVRHFFRTGRFAVIDGCDLVEEMTIENVTLTLCRCEHCKRYSLSWTGGDDDGNDGTDDTL